MRTCWVSEWGFGDVGGDDEPEEEGGGEVEAASEVDGGGGGNKVRIMVVSAEIARLHVASE